MEGLSGETRPQLREPSPQRTSQLQSTALAAEGSTFCIMG